MGALDGDDPVLLSKSLDDRHRSRLDDEEVAALVPGGEQDVAGLDLANATELAQPRPLVLVEAGEGAVAIRGLGDARADWLRLADHVFALSSFAGTICASWRHVAFEPFPVHEEGRRAMDSGPPGARRRPPGRARERCDRQAPRRPPPRPVRAAAPRSSRSSRENSSRPVSNRECASQNLPVGRGELGKLRREIRPRMKLGIGEVSPDEAQCVEAIEERHHRPAGGEAEPAPEVPVLDQSQLGRVGADDVIAVSERGQCAGGRGSHPIYVTQRPARRQSPVAAGQGRSTIVTGL